MRTPSIGTLTETLTLGIETSTRPLGCSTNFAGATFAAWPIVMIPPAVSCRPATSSSVIGALVVNGMTTVPGFEPSGIVIVLVTTWPDWLILTVTVPAIVRPSIPMSDAVPPA